MFVYIIYLEKIMHRCKIMVGASVAIAIAGGIYYLTVEQFSQAPAQLAEEEESEGEEEETKAE